MFEYVFAGIIAVLILWFLKDRQTDWPPGPTRVPVLGNLVQLAVMNRGREPYMVLKELSQTYGPLMTLKLGQQWQVLVDDKDLIREILAGDIWVDRPVNDWLLERSFGKPYGILWGSGESWRELRRFTLRTLRDFGFGKQKGQDAAMEEELTELMTNFNKQIGTTESPVALNMHKIFTVSVLNILWTMTAGIRFSHDDKRLSDFVHTISEAIRLISANGNIFVAFPFLRHVIPPLTGYGANRKALIKNMHNLLMETLEERRTLGYFKVEQRDYIDVFLYEIEKQKEAKGTSDLAPGDVFIEEHFIATTLDLFVAGSETTSNTLEFGLLYMMLNPEVQKKVQEEIEAVVGPNRFPAMTDKPNMPYTEATILEIQRMASVVPLTGRSPIHDARIGKYTVPKGTFTMFNLYSLHHNESIWEEPYAFRPERFLDKNQRLINADKILPFGLGKRLCLGEVLARASLFTYFTTLLQNYSFESSPEHGKPSLVPRFGLTLSPAPFHAIVKRRFV